MQTPEKQLSHTESMEIIQRMIGVAKNKIDEYGFHFLLWGTLVVAASLANYYLIVFSPSKYATIPWLLMPVIGIPLAFIYEFRKKRTAKAQTYNDSSYSFLWMGFGITLFFTIFYSVMNHISPIPFILSLVGLATFVSGCIFRYKWLIVGGIVFWLASVSAAFVPGPNQLLINAGATFIGYIIPGLLLWRKSKALPSV
jgi:hypothetical protein